MNDVSLASAGQIQSSVVYSLPSHPSRPTAPPKASVIEMPAPARTPDNQSLMMILPSNQGPSQIPVHVSKDTKHNTMKRRRGAAACHRYRQRRIEADRKDSPLEAELHQREEEANGEISRLKEALQSCQQMIYRLMVQNAQLKQYIFSQPQNLP